MNARTLPFQILVWDQADPAATGQSERVLSHRLLPYFAELAKFDSLPKLFKSPLWTEVGPKVIDCLGGVEYGFYGDAAPLSRKRFLRAVYFNLNGEVSYDTLLETVRTHPILGSADVYFFVNADIGMARSGNVNMVRSLALEMSCHYVFVPTHFVMDDDGVGANKLSITGLSVLSRFPVSEFQVYPMMTATDPLRGKNKKLGAPKALFVKIATPHAPLNVLLFSLDAISSPRFRARQMQSVLSHYEKLKMEIPLLVAGSWQTTNYNTRTSWRLFMSFLNKIVRDFDYIATEHHAYPERFFERRLFRYLEKIGLDFENFNQAGSATWHCRFEDLDVKRGLSLKVANSMIRMIKRFFYHGPDKIALKTDWFAASSQVVVSEDPQAEKPKVLPNHYSGGTIITQHHPMVLDFELKKGQDWA